MSALPGLWDSFKLFQVLVYCYEIPWKARLVTSAVQTCSKRWVQRQGTAVRWVCGPNSRWWSSVRTGAAKPRTVLASIVNNSLQEPFLQYNLQNLTTLPLQPETVRNSLKPFMLKHVKTEQRPQSTATWSPTIRLTGVRAKVSQPAECHQRPCDASLRHRHLKRSEFELYSQISSRALPLLQLTALFELEHITMILQRLHGWVAFLRAPAMYAKMNAIFLLGMGMWTVCF